jgi:hypothetical protein
MWPKIFTSSIDRCAQIKRFEDLKGKKSPSAPSNPHRYVDQGNTRRPWIEAMGCRCCNGRDASEIRGFDVEECASSASAFTASFGGDAGGF